MKVKADLVYCKSTDKRIGFRDLGDFKFLDYEAQLQKESAPQHQLAEFMLVFQVCALFSNFHFPLHTFPPPTPKAISSSIYSGWQ